MTCRTGLCGRTSNAFGKSLEEGHQGALVPYWVVVDWYVPVESASDMVDIAGGWVVCSCRQDELDISFFDHRHKNLMSGLDFSGCRHGVDRQPLGVWALALAGALVRPLTCPDQLNSQQPPHWPEPPGFVGPQRLLGWWG